MTGFADPDDREVALREGLEIDDDRERAVEHPALEDRDVERHRVVALNCPEHVADHRPVVPQDLPDVRLIGDVASDDFRIERYGVEDAAGRADAGDRPDLVAMRLLEERHVLPAVLVEIDDGLDPGEGAADPGPPGEELLDPLRRLAGVERLLLVEDAHGVGLRRGVEEDEEAGAAREKERDQQEQQLPPHPSVPSGRDARSTLRRTGCSADLVLPPHI